MINIEDMLKNIDTKALEKLKDAPENFRKELKKISVISEAGGGLVAIKGSGNGTVSSVHIDASLLPDNQARKTLEDLMVAAFNSMHKKIEYEVEKLKNDKLMSMLPDFMNK